MLVIIIRNTILIYTATRQANAAMVEYILTIIGDYTYKYIFMAENVSIIAIFLEHNIFIDGNNQKLKFISSTMIRGQKRVRSATNIIADNLGIEYYVCVFTACG